MSHRHISLARLGWSGWFEDQFKLQSNSYDVAARVAAVDRDQLLLTNELGAFRAKLSGSYLYQHPLPQERPCVGDWVCVEKHQEDDLGLIQVLLLAVE